jgi:hypothetical protein
MYPVMDLHDAASSFYSVHGLTVRSPIAFASHTIEGSAERPQIVIASPRFAPSKTAKGSESSVFKTSWCEILRVADVGPRGARSYLMVYAQHGFSFLVQHENDQVQIEPLIHNDEWALMLPVMLCGAVTTFACRLLGFVALHANCVTIDGHAVALAGASEAGKTLTSSLGLLGGATLVSDDVTVIHDNGVVHSGLLELRLRVDDPLGQVVADLLRESVGVSTSVTPDERQSIRFDQSAKTESVVLTKVVLPLHDPTATAFSLETLSLAESLMAVLNSYRLIGWVDPDFQRSDFLNATRLAEQLQIQRLRMPTIAADPESVQHAADELISVLTKSSCGS